MNKPLTCYRYSTPIMYSYFEEPMYLVNSADWISNIYWLWYDHGLGGSRDLNHWCMGVEHLPIKHHKRHKETLLANTNQFRYAISESIKNAEQREKINLMEELIMQNNTLTTTGLINGAKNYAINYAITRIKNEFGVMLKLHFGAKEYKKFLCWLKKHDKNFKSHIQAEDIYGTEKNYRLKDCNFIIKCGHNTFAHIYTQTAIKNTLTKVDIFSDVKVHDDEVYMYIFGKECHKVAKTIKKIDSHTNIACFKISAPKNNRYNDGESTPEIYYEDLNGRRKDSIFLNGDVKDQIMHHIDKFLANRELYRKRNLIYKTGILLYGEPGTGKSSIANMIATEYNSDMVLINMSEFSKINTDFLASTINADDKFYIVVLEDIDCVIGDREDENDDLENKKNVNKLLQFLDSTSSPTNVVFVATTNHIDKLDDAVKRDGRFDLIVNITNINRETAIKMCKSFGITDMNVVNDILSKNMVDGRINPAKLQNLILQNIELNNKTVIE